MFLDKKGRKSSISEGLQIPHLAKGDLIASILDLTNDPVKNISLKREQGRFKHKSKELDLYTNK